MCRSGISASFRKKTGAAEGLKRERAFRHLGGVNLQRSPLQTSRFASDVSGEVAQAVQSFRHPSAQVSSSAQQRRAGWDGGSLGRDAGKFSEKGSGLLSASRRRRRRCRRRLHTPHLPQHVHCADVDVTAPLQPAVVKDEAQKQQSDGLQPREALPACDSTVQPPGKLAGWFASKSVRLQAAAGLYQSMQHVCSWLRPQFPTYAMQLRMPGCCCCIRRQDAACADDGAGRPG